MKLISYLILLVIVMAGCKTEPKMIETEAIYKTQQFGFSQAIKANGFLFTSGQVGWDRAYKLTGEGQFKDQVKQSFKNVEQVVEAGNSSMGNVVRLRFYVKKLDEEKRVIIGQYMTQYYPAAYKPATTLIGIETLAREELQIEIEVIAKIKQ